MVLRIESKLRAALLSMIAILVLPGLAHANLSCDAPLFATSFDGDAELGSKSELIASLNRGEKIRLGWQLDFNEDGLADLTHWADAAFVSVWRGEVYAQVNSIQKQTLEYEEGTLKLTPDDVEWRGLLSTKGGLAGTYTDGSVFPTDLRARIVWCSDVQRPPPVTLLFRNGLNGEPLAGSRQALLSAIRAGHPIRVGWGFSAVRDGKEISIEHVVSPTFVSIVGGTEVAVHLPQHIAQAGYLDVEKATFDEPAVVWSGILTTGGAFDAVWVNSATGETIRRMPQRAVVSWYSASPSGPSAPSLARDKGVILATTIDAPPE